MPSRGLTSIFSGIGDASVRSFLTNDFGGPVRVYEYQVKTKALHGVEILSALMAWMNLTVRKSNGSA